MDESYKQNNNPKPSDDDTPFSQPDDVTDDSNPNHPQMDTNVDSDEVYHHGLGIASHVDPTDADEVELEGDSH